MLHEQIIVLTIVTKDEPYVDVAHRIKIRAFGEKHNFFRVKLYYGFQQSPDVRQALQLCAQEGLNIDFKQKTAYEIRLSLVGSEMCIRDRCKGYSHSPIALNLPAMLHLTPDQ